MLILLLLFHVVTVPLAIAGRLLFNLVRHPDLLSLDLNCNVVPFSKKENDSTGDDIDRRRAA